MCYTIVFGLTLFYMLGWFDSYQTRHVSIPVLQKSMMCYGLNNPIG